MDIRVIKNGKRDLMQIDNARITYRNFEGRSTQYNREGDRNFSIIIPDEETANMLMDMGLNVKIKAPRDEDDTPFMHLKVKVNFDSRIPPTAYLRSGNSTPRKLNADTIGLLDDVDILNVDLDLNISPWDVNGKQGSSAYLSSICVTQNVDRFAERFASEEYPEE